MSQPIITIITISYNTSDFVELMLYAFKKLTKNRYRVLICDNGSNDADLKKLRELEKRYENTEVVYRQQSQGGSIGHAEALEAMIEKVETPYFTVMDADCTFLLKHWDEKLLSYINHKVKLAGTPRGVNLADKFVKVYGGYPAQYAVLVETKIFKTLEIKCMPGNISEGQDTCWEWKKKFMEAGYQGMNLDIVNTRDDQTTPYKDQICALYYTDEGKLIASHFGRGSSGGEAKYKNWYYWQIPFISEYFRKRKSIAEKQRWLTISKEIIDAQ